MSSYEYGKGEDRPRNESVKRAVPSLTSQIEQMSKALSDHEQRFEMVLARLAKLEDRVG